MPYRPSNLSTSNGFQTSQETLLSPRTPRSQARESDELENDLDIVSDEQQRQPLLLSPANNSKRLEAKVISNSRSALLRQIPLVLIGLLAVILLVLVILTYNNPSMLLGIIPDPGSKEIVIPPSPSLSQSDDPLEQSEQPSSLDSNTSQFVDYTEYNAFPLEPLQYAAECWKLHQKPTQAWPYWETPPDGLMDVHHRNPTDSQCTSTITYQLDEYAGMFAHLALLAQVASMAQERNRTLLVDDRFWNRGKWTDHFRDIRVTQPGPEPGCTPPPLNELVACPRIARHWVVNSRTAKFHFSTQFESEYHNGYGHGVDRLHPLFDRALEAFTNTILPSAQTANLIHLARSDIGDAPYVGMHLRRGDQKPVSWRFHEGYVPIQHFVDSAVQTRNNLAYENAEVMGVWLATDSYVAEGDVANALPQNIEVTGLLSSPHQALRELSPEVEYVQGDWDKLSVERRVLETRGVIVDFALLSGAWRDDRQTNRPEAVICTIMSSICTLSAVHLGWQEAFAGKKWVEIDNAGAIEPTWRAFQLF